MQSVEFPDIPAQLAGIHGMIYRKGLTDKWNLLPPADALTFAPKDDDPVLKDMFARKLFLGGDENEQIWAYLRPYRAKTSEIHIFIERLDKKGSLLKEEVIADDFKDHQLMYPFEILRTKEGIYGRHMLNVLLMVYYMEARQTNRIWSGNGSTAIKPLTIAINSIDKAYKTFPNGK